MTQPNSYDQGNAAAAHEAGRPGLPVPQPPQGQKIIFPSGYDQENQQGQDPNWRPPFHTVVESDPNQPQPQAARGDFTSAVQPPVPGVRPQKIGPEFRVFRGDTQELPGRGKQNQALPAGSSQPAAELTTGDVMTPDDALNILSRLRAGRGYVSINGMNFSHEDVSRLQAIAEKGRTPGPTRPSLADELLDMQHGSQNVSAEPTPAAPTHPTPTPAKAERQGRRSAMEVANGPSLDPPAWNQEVIAVTGARYYTNEDGVKAFIRKPGEGPKEAPEGRLAGAEQSGLMSRLLATTGIPDQAMEDRSGMFVRRVQTERYQRYKPDQITVTDPTDPNKMRKVVEAQPGVVYVTDGEQTETILGLGVNGRWAPNSRPIGHDNRTDVFAFSTKGQVSYADMLDLAQRAYPDLFERVEDAGFIFPPALKPREVYSPNLEEDITIEPAGFAEVLPKVRLAEPAPDAEPAVDEPVHMQTETDGEQSGSDQERVSSRFAQAIALGKLVLTNVAMLPVTVPNKLMEMVGRTPKKPTRLRAAGRWLLAGSAVASGLGFGQLHGTDTVHHAQAISHSMSGTGLGHGLTPDHLPADHAPLNLPDAVNHHPHPGDNQNLYQTPAAPAHAPAHSIQTNPNHQYPDGTNPNLPQHPQGNVGAAPQPPTEALTHAGDTISNHVLNQLHHLGYHVGGRGNGAISRDTFNHIVAGTVADNHLTPDQVHSLQVGRPSFHLLSEAQIHQMVEEIAKEKSAA